MGLDKVDVQKKAWTFFFRCTWRAERWFQSSGLCYLSSQGEKFIARSAVCLPCEMRWTTIPNHPENHFTPSSRDARLMLPHGFLVLMLHIAIPICTNCLSIAWSLKSWYISMCVMSRVWELTTDAPQGFHSRMVERRFLRAVHFLVLTAKHGMSWKSTVGGRQIKPFSVCLNMAIV